MKEAMDFTCEIFNTWKKKCSQISCAPLERKENLSGFSRVKEWRLVVDFSVLIIREKNTEIDSQFVKIRTTGATEIQVVESTWVNFWSSELFEWCFTAKRWHLSFVNGWVVGILWHINLCGLFNTNCFYIWFLSEYFIFKRVRIYLFACIWIVSSIAI